jgi:enoyl-CoA hydratase
MSRVQLITGPNLAEIVIDHPPLNLFDSELFAELRDAIESVKAAPPRGLLIRAEGRVVSGGVDVALFDSLTLDGAARLWDENLAIVDALESLPLPTVFAAHSLTLTAAFELALACDIIVAARSARFGLVEAVVGLTPSLGGTQRLAERAGFGRALELVMTGELFGAEEMERWNVVNRVFDDEQFHEEARALAVALADGPTRAHAMTKRIVRRYRDGGVAAADDAVRSDAHRLFETEDLRQAVRSFIERGPGHAEFANR